MWLLLQAPQTGPRSKLRNFLLKAQDLPPNYEMSVKQVSQLKNISNILDTYWVNFVVWFFHNTMNIIF